MRRLRAQDGFTLIEIQVVIVLMIIVLGAVLTTFNQSESVQRVNQDQNDAQSQNRRAIDLLARELRNLASSSTQTPQAVERVGDYDLTFQTVQGQTVTRVRYCLGESQGGKATLWRQDQVSPLTVFPSHTSCPDSDPNWTDGYLVAQHVVNREESAPIFTANTTDVSAVDAFSVELLVDVNPGKAPLPSRLSSGVFLRNQNRPPIAAATATWTGSVVLLNGTASRDPEGNALVSYEWFADGDLDDPIATGPVAQWAPTETQHTFTLRVTDAGGNTHEFTTGTVSTE